MNSKTIPMELAYYKHDIYTSLEDVELVVEYPNGKFSYFKINEKGEIIEKHFGLDKNTCSHKESDYYYLDHCSLEQLQAIEPLRKKFELTYVISNLKFLRDFFTLESTEYKDFDMPHANILTETLDCLKQMYIHNEDVEILLKYKEFDQFTDDYFFDFSGQLNEDVKITLNQKFTDLIVFLESWNF